jgi:haloalkane dehalogenase
VLGVERCVPVTHDWGGLIGLRWACDHPGAVAALVISSSGFFPDGKWHGMAQAMRTPEVGEQAIAGLDRAGFGGLLRSTHPGFGEDELDEYWKGLADEARRRNALELYRSGDFEKLAGYRLADLNVPVLLIWGVNDEFAPLAGAHRFQRELPDTELVAIEGAGHFVWDEQPERCAAALTTFLERLA